MHDRYKTVLSILLYENQVYWTRWSYFLAAHSAALGFFYSRMPFDSLISPATRPFLVFGSLGGMLFSYLWRRICFGAEEWIAHWEGALRELEQPAFGRLELYRGAHVTGNVKLFARATITLVNLAWIVIFSYVIGQWLASR